MSIKTNRPKKDRIRALSVHITAAKFDVTENYVRQIVRGDADQEEIKRSYNKTYQSFQKVANA